MNRKNKAIFLDRDGVINYDGDEYYTYRIEDFKLNEGILEALKILKDRGYLLIIISNQGGIGRGLYKKEDTDHLHEYMTTLMEEKGIILDEIYYCPHYPDSSKCLCRKPNSLMIEKALARFDIIPEQSYFIGDREKDVEVAIKAGVIPIKINANENLIRYLDKIK
ncbi:MAG: HAD family hydrolase [Bacteroidales bacterium]|nr:HAD family hydrolase [Bacteroidales bacterium]